MLNTSSTAIPISSRSLSGTTLRPLSCELSCLAGADGSALFRSGQTQVLASVHGPIAPRLPQHEDQDRARISVVIKSPSGGDQNPGSSFPEREWEAWLGDVLASAVAVEEMPRTVLQVVVAVLTADGSVLAAALHAAVSALMDTGNVPMKLLPTAVTCLCRRPTSGSASEGGSTSIQLDPTAEQERSGEMCVVLAVGPAAADGSAGNKNGDKMLVLASHTYSYGSSSALSLERFLECCELAYRASPAITAFWRLVVDQKATRESQTLWST